VALTKTVNPASAIRLRNLWVLATNFSVRSDDSINRSNTLDAVPTTGGGKLLENR